MALTADQRKAMFAVLEIQSNRKKRRSINKKLFNDNIAIAKARKLKGEKTGLHTNRLNETFVFGQKGDNIRTLGFVGHTSPNTGLVIASKKVTHN